MTASHLWNPTTMSTLMIHLWQSTAFAVLVWFLTLTLRNYPARARFLVWMAASIKFLVSFALLTALGSHWALPNSRPQMHGTFYTVIEEINQPFASSPLPTPDPGMPVHNLVDRSWISIAFAGFWFCGCIFMLIRWAGQWLSARRLVNGSVTLAEGREVVALRQAEAGVRIRKPIPVATISKTVEPGIFGVMRPVLIWPAGLSERLDDAHIASIVAHELEHVRRRDNLTAALHSLVEAVFWFHPVVWWMGVKMTEERERACDERVLELNAEPRTYADSILRVCAFCLESPLPCVAGVSGSDLKKRVLRIASHRSGVTLKFGRRALLLAAAVLAITLPIGFGVVCGQSSVRNSRTPKSSTTPEALQFDIVSIKPTAPNQDKTLFQYFPDGISFRGAPVRMVLETAFGVDDNHIVGPPAWVTTRLYDIEAKVAPEDAPKLERLRSTDQNAMLIPLLTERFNLKYHHDTRERPIYALVVAKGGLKLTKGELDPPPGWKPAKDTPPEKEHYKVMTVPGHIEADSIPMFVLADQLSRLNALGRTVVDKTGLIGNYNFNLQWTPDNAPFPMMSDADGLGATTHSENATDSTPSSLFSAIQEQLGLKLEPEKGSDDVIVIDHIDPPSPK
jgi:bla regulator protein blaR1